MKSTGVLLGGHGHLDALWQRRYHPVHQGVRPRQRYRDRRDLEFPLFAGQVRTAKGPNYTIGMEPEERKRTGLFEEENYSNDLVVKTASC